MKRGTKCLNKLQRERWLQGGRRKEGRSVGWWWWGGGGDTYIVTLHCMLIIPSILLILYFSGAVDLTAKDTDTIRHEHPEDNRS